MDDSTPLKRLRAQIENAAQLKKVAKTNHTLYLSEGQFKAFRTYCRIKDVRASEIIDRLIAMYLEEVKDDLPPDP